MPYIAALIAAFLFSLGAPPALASPAPRETVAAAAKAIEDNYYDPAMGARIADDLRSAAQRGEFDRFGDPRELATALSSRLSPLDAHFAVTWSADAPAASPGPQPAGGPPAGDPDRRANYGFKRVEILPGNIGYIDLRFFAGFDPRDPAAPARKAADAALTLTGGADALVFDLRDNGGGSPAMVGYLTSAFVAPGADVYNIFHSREGTHREAPEVPYARPDLDVPVFILMSGRTGSAAEAFAYTLKNARRGVVIGEASAGAANPGRTHRLPGGFSIFVSGGSPKSPITGRNWEGSGVEPDVRVPAADALQRAQRLALEKVLAGGLAGGERRDAEWALAALDPAPAIQPLDELAGEYSGVRVTVVDGRLQYVRGRRPAWTLVPVGRDLFRDAEDPSRRIRFERDASGRVTGLEIVYPDGPVGLYRRGA